MVSDLTLTYDDHVVEMYNGANVFHIKQNTVTRKTII